MKKGMKTTLIALIAIIAVMIMAVPVSASSEGEVTSVKLSKSTATLNVGDNIGLGVTYTATGEIDETVDWSTSNSSVATVKKGFVKTKKAGKVKITAELDGEEASCTITVKAKAPKFVSSTGCYKGLNKYRKAAHKKGLKKDKKLEKIAKIRAKEIAKTGKFSHTRPNGKSGLTLIKGNIYKGENIAMGQKTCAQVTKAWYNSKGHKKNMLKKQYKKVGIAGYEYNGVIYWVQVFSS